MVLSVFYVCDKSLHRPLARLTKNKGTADKNSVVPSYDYNKN